MLAISCSCLQAAVVVAFCFVRGHIHRESTKEGDTKASAGFSPRHHERAETMQPFRGKVSFTRKHFKSKEVYESHLKADTSDEDH